MEGEDDGVGFRGVLDDEERAVGDEGEELGVGDDFVGGGRLYGASGDSGS